MKTAIFYCTACSYTQKTAAENAGKQYSCPKCGTVGNVLGDDPNAPPVPPKADPFFDAKAKIATAADAAKGAASKAAVTAGTTVTSAMEKTRNSPGLANAGAKLSQAFSKAASSVADTASTVAARAKEAANSESFEQTPQATPEFSLLQGMANKQVPGVVLYATLQQKNRGLGMMLSYLFGGVGILYTSVGWGLLFTVIEFLLWGIIIFTFGLASLFILPVIFIFHIGCLIFSAVFILKHNKRLVNIFEGTTSTQLPAPMLFDALQQRSLGLGLMLTILFGGVGTLYTSIVWGLVFAIIQSLLWGMTFFTFGIGFPVIVAFHILCLVFVAVSITNNNKHSATILEGM